MGRLVSVTAGDMASRNATKPHYWNILSRVSLSSFTNRKRFLKRIIRWNWGCEEEATKYLVRRRTMFFYRYKTWNVIKKIWVSAVKFQCSNSASETEQVIPPSFQSQLKITDNLYRFSTYEVQPIVEVWRLWLGGGSRVVNHQQDCDARVLLCTLQHTLFCLSVQLQRNVHNLQTIFFTVQSIFCLHPHFFPPLPKTSRHEQ